MLRKSRPSAQRMGGWLICEWSKQLILNPLIILPKPPHPSEAPA